MKALSQTRRFARGEHPHEGWRAGVARHHYQFDAAIRVFHVAAVGGKLAGVNHKRQALTQLLLAKFFYGRCARRRGEA